MEYDISMQAKVLKEESVNQDSLPGFSLFQPRMPGQKAVRSMLRFCLVSLLAFSVLLMNIYFAWTSHVWWGDPALRSVISGFARNQMNFIGLSSWYIGMKSMAVREFIDLEVVALALSIATLTFLLFLRRGPVKATLKMLELGSLSVMPLGIEIYILDRAEFNIHASIAQVETGFLAWFTNADLLYLALATFFIAAFIDYRHRLAKMFKRPRK